MNMGYILEIYLGYIKGPAPMNYLDAYLYCNLKGTTLGLITNSNDNEHANDVCGNNNCWIGYNDIGNEGHFRWLSGNSHYTNFKANEPNNLGSQHCVHLLSNSRQWNDADCLNKKYIPLCDAPQYSANSDTTNNLIETMESEVDNDLDNKPNGIYVHDINVTLIVSLCLGIALGIICIVSIISAYIKSDKQFKCCK